MSENLRFAIAIALSFLVFFVWNHFFPQNIYQPEEKEVVTEKISDDFLSPEDKSVLIKEEFDETHRINLSTKKLYGSVSLKGLEIDDISLKGYKESVEKDSENVVLLSPRHTENVYFLRFGFATEDEAVEMPDQNTVWKCSNSAIGEEKNVIFSWTNKQGITFKVSLYLDEGYLFNIEHLVENNGEKDVKITPYTIVTRSYIPPKDKTSKNNGSIGVFAGKLEEVSFEDIENSSQSREADWIGFTDKYWLIALISSDKKASTRMRKFNISDQDRYQIDFFSKAVLVKSKKSASIMKSKAFVGAKEVNILDEYKEKFGIKLFDRTIDFGMLYFLTKGMSSLLHVFHELIGNFGFAILLLTLFIKSLLFPLAYKSFKSMNRLKELQPQMETLKERLKDDSQGLQKAMLQLYKKEKVNPLSGCLPVLLQMPVFFALYRVLSINIEMRHAPFVLFVKDLSASDPTNIFNLFGLLPIDPFFHLGILPILMALTMLLQQSLNPTPQDKTQAQVMRFLPLFFLVLFASFPAGLIIYWTFSNLLSILQQIAIKYLSKR